jgi:hypothetical protein
MEASLYTEFCYKQFWEAGAESRGAVIKLPPEVKKVMVAEDFLVICYNFNPIRVKHASSCNSDLRLKEMFLAPQYTTLALNIPIFTLSLSSLHR